MVLKGPEEPIVELYSGFTSSQMKNVMMVPIGSEQSTDEVYGGFTGWFIRQYK